MAEACALAPRPTVAPPARIPVKSRFQGVDVARGVALISMLAANVFVDVVTDDGTPTLSGMTVIGRSATMFVLVAGISLAFISGGLRPVQGVARRAARANIAVRALCIGAIGLALGYTAPDNLGVILGYYGLFFLLAIPLIGLRSRTLVAVAGVLVAVGPLVLLGAEYLGWESGFDSDPTLAAPVTDPLGLLSLLTVTGDYPAVVYMAYICVGLAIGRLDLSSTRVALRLLVGGLALAVVTWVASWLLVERLGGLQALLAAEAGETPGEVVWDTSPTESWWWLATRAHHSGTPLDMLHTIGSAIAVLGLVLLVCRLRSAQRLLRPVALAGAMTLTVYSAHAFVLLSPWTETRPLAVYLLLVVGALVFAVLWHRWRGQGPLERLVAMVANRARRAVLAAPAESGSGSGREPEPSGAGR
ncbi:heparan-alpha-glucosaminide N-acetyltransferase domain-containing protein [Geodermatophilus sp. SYSU D00708]